MKMPNSAEMIAKLSREKAIALIYIMAVEALQANKSLEEFVKELEVLAKEK